MVHTDAPGQHLLQHEHLQYAVYNTITITTPPTAKTKTQYAMGVFVPMDLKNEKLGQKQKTVTS